MERRASMMRREKRYTHGERRMLAEVTRSPSSRFLENDQVMRHGMNLLGLAGRAEIVIRTHRALVPDPNDGKGIASITSNSMMFNRLDIHFLFMFRFLRNTDLLQERKSRITNGSNSRRKTFNLGQILNGTGESTKREGLWNWESKGSQVA